MIRWATAALGAAAVFAFVQAPNPAMAKLNSCEGPVTLGTTMSSTGRYSTQAERWRDMTLIFAEEFNKKGGVFIKSCNKKLPIKFVIYDDQSVPSLAVTLYEKLATVDKVDFFVGPDWSAMGFPVPPVAEKHKIPMVMANVAAPPIFKRGLKYMWGTPMPTVPNWSIRYFDLLAKQTPKPKTIYFVIQDNPITKAISRFWVKAAEKRGFKVVGQELFSHELRDFTSLVLKMRIAKPDIIYISSFDVPSVPLIQQMRRLRTKAKDVHHTILTGALQAQLGKDIEGMTGEVAWFPGVKGPYSDFAEVVLNRAKIDMFYYWTTMSRFSSYLIMLQAIEKAGVVDREAVRKALYKGKFKTPIGIVEFNAEGYAYKNGAMTSQIQNGKVVIVAPADRATGKFQYPSKSWQ
ncbi:MAG: amino acid ABC transporter substrate-binding protein [Rhodospirillales bacterium]|nr:amino acid ABC transporter substrate-binding protein [Rhodospirillales bacterium]